MKNNKRDLAEGLVFATFWASATVATKFAIRSVDAFLLTCIRFLVVGSILLLYIYLIKRNRPALPNRVEFRKLFLLGLLNITLYMTGFLIAVQTVSAGLISLLMATNPLILIIMSAIFLHKKPTRNQWIGIVVCLIGLVFACIPNLQNSHATLLGLIALIIGNIALSAGSIYYSGSKIGLPKLTVNAWQVTIGGLLFIPIVCIDPRHFHLNADLNFFLSFAWLVIPVSIIAYALWLHLLHKDPVKAGGWLFLTPALGYLMAVVIMHEKITGYGITGALLVVAGLMYSRKK